MPYALILAGIVLTVAGVRNTQATLYTLLEGDFTGPHSFVWWTLSIVGIGAVGYAPALRTFANYFLALILIVLVIANKGVFEQFTNALKNPIPAATPASASASTSSGNTVKNPLATGQSLLSDAIGAFSNATNPAGSIASIPGAQ
jgi:hypothetical protein